MRPSQIHDWDGSAWVINEEKKAELLKNQQSATWEHIKAERTRRTEGGVYVKSVDKWFHTDQPSRIQYLSIQQMPTLPESFAWKTMDNTFVNMTKALIDELILSLRIKEQADFANAERHKAAMLESDNPADYDYSAGWSDIYDE
ncbi:hypothetical protein QV08_12440 [Gallibacterium salpingitidis]|uniref:DUF4376 domain-containing protein n=1 Tax=Gallibacterium salpingitidis TaxID=505341 RepID=A0AB36E2L8_9PAST|nr:hypothetical protein QV08_12440 [Gallibacterium salpingitidis]OBX10465.1 hypothetical protein QV09_05635 [Gallibacterium salpingitidis]